MPTLPTHSLRPFHRLHQLLTGATTSLLLAVCVLDAQPGPRGAPEVASWEAQAQRVTIYRDTWGIAHVYGTSDADAVFGMIYAQAEDDFPRIERTDVNALGRLAEIEGEREIWRDLRMKLFIDTLDMKRHYAESPAWLKTLMDAWAGGLNYYLHTHPNVQPQLLRRFEPWMALAFSEGSIGGDIESINLRALEAFYGPRSGTRAGSTGSGFASSASRGGSPSAVTTETHNEHPAWRDEPGGSNGFAIAPANTKNGHALLMINPHTSFYFRPEIHMASSEGLDAYGAVTWGQFFIYQGFNARVGWMHTSGGGDVIDEYRVAPIARGSGYAYRHGSSTRAVRAKRIVLPYTTASGMASRTVTAYFTHHGPVVRGDSGQWIAVQLMQEPLKAIQQSYLRTKARDYASFREVMNLRTNSSNNTVYADADGTIAYFHGNFIPKRDTSIDFTDVVDGSDPRTDWQGLHALDDMIALKNPESG
jgi:acyl-homoserine-lactone acylase